MPKLLYYVNHRTDPIKVGNGTLTEANLVESRKWADKNAADRLAHSVDAPPSLDVSRPLQFVKLGEDFEPTADVKLVHDLFGPNPMYMSLWYEKPDDTIIRVLPFQATLTDLIMARSVKKTPKFWGYPDAQPETVQEDEQRKDSPPILPSNVEVVQSAAEKLSARQERLRKDEAAARRSGWAPAGTVVPFGTELVSFGKDRWRQLRKEWQNTPPTVDGLKHVIGQVAAERRQDRIVSASRLRMNSDGLLELDGDLVKLEAMGVKQLISKLTDGGFVKPEEAAFEAEIVSELSDDVDYVVGKNLFPSAFDMFTALDPDIRADMFNRHIERHANPTQKLKMRLRVSPKDQTALQCYSVAGPRYTAFDADKVAQTLIRALYQMNGGRQARGNVLYNPATTSMKVEAIWHADLPFDGGGAGDFFKGGIVGRSNDASGGGISGNALLYRNLCVNLLIVAAAKKELFHITHRSSAGDIIETMNIGMEQAGKDFAYFLEKWGIIHATPVASVWLWGKQFETVEQAIQYAVENGIITAGVGKDVLLETLLNCHSAEPVQTLDGLVNAMTRAHDEKYSKLVQSAVESLEEQAGELVLVLASAVQSN